MRNLLFIISALLLAACSFSDRPSASLQEAESLLSRDPEKAFEKLTSLDVASFRDSSDVALWALLYSEAIVANHLHAPSDSIINIAIDYYGRHDSMQLLSRAREVRHLSSINHAIGVDPLLEARYIQKEKEYSLYKERIHRERIVLYGIILLVIACLVISILRRRLNEAKYKNVALLAEASALRQTLETKSSDTSQLEEILQELLGKRFALINRLCDTYYETNGTKNERNAIVTSVHNEIDAIRQDKSVFNEMVRTVNQCRGKLLILLKREYPKIKPEEYRLAVYLACGFSARTISLLTGDAIETIYKRKSRLKLRLRDLNPPHLAEFMDIF